jgi:cytochrome c-type biogenesis protein CcmH/NrfG
VARTPEAEAEVLRLLAEIGYAAAGHGLGKEAGRIFEALAIADPHNVAADVGRALIALSSGRFEEAVQYLWRDALAKDPDNRDVKILLGHALRFAGRNDDGVRFLQEAEVAEVDRGPATALPVS